MPTKGEKEVSPQMEEAIRLRQLLLERLESEGATEHAQKLRECAQTMTLVCQCCGVYQEVPTRCKRRWCPVCARILSAERSRRFSRYVAQFSDPLFVTLTARNVDTLGYEQMRQIRRAWSKLRRRRVFRWVLGGISTFEITNTGHGWHPHLHAVIDCQWLGTPDTKPRRCDNKATWKRLAARAGGELQQHWGECLQAVGWQQHDLLPVIKVKRCDAVGIAVEIAKYCIKASDLIECAGKATTLIDAIQGCRLVTKFGHCHGVPVEDIDPEPERPGLQCDCPQGRSVWGMVPNG